MMKKFFNLLFNNNMSDKKRKELKQINTLIGECKNYKELVILVNLYNKIKNEDKTN